ncbi:MAG: uracil-DNA glycosylase [Chloroflexi bacterium]|nr:uracil-DNA glycosylase [Chloroflexota bacterium]
MMQRGDKAEALARLREEARMAGRHETGFAFGEGSPEARLMIVGEAPGRREAELGKPFVGASGKLLDRLLEAARIDRDEVWITNVVKWRPTREEGGRVNRAPRAAEVAADSAWLERELEVIRPRVVLCLGIRAASSLIHPDFKMNAERGKWFPGPLGSRAMASFHPAYVLRQQGADGEQLIDLMQQDFREIGKAIER